MPDLTIRTLAPPDLARYLTDLCELTSLAVNTGAAISFVLPHTVEDSRSFWSKTVFPGVVSGDIILLVALADDRAIGTVQLHVAMPANQPHRCEVAKLIVHPDFRRGGVATRLMNAAEGEAMAHGKHLIMLDTRTGDRAERIYRSLGYQTVGVVPGFALDPDKKSLHATTYMYRALTDAAATPDGRSG